jgi:choline dehydrogenase
LQRCGDGGVVKELVYSHHATSTRAIGGDRDKGKILGSKFRVRGVRVCGLWMRVHSRGCQGGSSHSMTIELSDKATVNVLSELRA